MVKGAIFDLDGTIIDSMFIWDDIGASYLRSMQIEPKENLADTLRTFTVNRAAEYLQKNYGLTSSVQEIVNHINNLVREAYSTRVFLKPGVKDFLKRLHNMGVKMCIATVTDKKITENVLERLSVREYFSGIFVSRQNKECADVYLQALEHLGTEKDETVVFEDAYHALKTAVDAGFKVAAVYDAHEPRQEDMRKISDYYVKDYECFCFKTKMKTALTIAGSDSSGGAGIQADIKTMTMNGVYAMSAVTALTAQNTCGVKAVLESSPEFMKEQLDAVFEDIFPDSVKIGMVASGELIGVIAERLRFYNARNIVVDPVMVATSGAELIKTDAVNSLVSRLLPIAILVTPNIPEAEVLSGIKIHSGEDMLKAAELIWKKSGCNVLLKGGHSIDDADDLLYENGKVIRFPGKRIDNPNTHGTGCTLSSAIASNLAKGLSLTDSVQQAKKYVSEALLQGLDLGKGQGPMMHNFVIYNS